MDENTKAEDVKRVLRSIQEDLRIYSKNVDRMYDNGIPGIDNKVINPALESGQNGNGDEYLYDFPSFYQMDGVEFLLEKKRVLIADEMGAGKTAQAIAGKLEIENRYGKTVKALVVTPNQVKKHWEEKIGKYTTREQKIVKLDSYDEESLAEIDDADFTIVNFDVFGNRDLRDSITERLLREGFDYVILDEVHNTKNPSARRSRHLRRISNNAEYLCLLSGTPIPDSLADTYMLIALLESDIYKDIVLPGEEEVSKDAVRDITPQDATLVDKNGRIIKDEKGRTVEGSYYVTCDGSVIVSDEKGRLRKGRIVRTAPQVIRDTYWRHPTLIRAVLGRRKLRRDMADITDLPEIHRYPPGLKGTIELTPEQQAVYNTIYENDELDGAYKLQQLRKALTDPSLVNPDLLPEDLRERAEHMDSVKYKALDKIIKKRIAKGEKVVVFSPMFKAGLDKRLGVVKKLQERYKEYGALRTDGDIRGSEKKEKIRKMFQKNPENKVLIATDVASEGISLTAASTVVFLDEPYSPGDRSQMVKRVHRPGQEKEVDIISLAIADTVDDGMLELLYLKQEAIDFMEKGMRLRPEHIDAMGQKPSSSRPLTDREYTPQQKIRRYSTKFAGMGSKRISKALKRHDSAMAKNYAKWYRMDWEESYSANVIRGVKKVLDSLSPKINLKEKLDIASGFGVLSEITGEETTNVELNEYHFDTPSERNIVASMHKMPLPDGHFDLAVCSLALYDATIEKEWEKRKRSKKKDKPSKSAKPETRVTEREKAIREANRVLKDNGYYIVTMSRTVITQEQDMKFRENFAKLGFEVVPELIGYVRIGGKTNFQTYMAVMRKTGPPQDEPLEPDDLFLEVDDRTAGKRRKTYSGAKGIFEEFAFINHDGSEDSIEDRANEYLKRLFGDDV